MHEDPKKKPFSPSKGMEAINVRFFIYDETESDDDNAHREVTEGEFEEAIGDIAYQRHTVFENGVRQICLTKTVY
jgi:hypothetical protein